MAGTGNKTIQVGKLALNYFLMEKSGSLIWCFEKSTFVGK